jgi:hypothetical protein
VSLLVLILALLLGLIVGQWRALLLPLIGLGVALVAQLSGGDWSNNEAAATGAAVMSLFVTALGVGARQLFTRGRTPAHDRSRIRTSAR